MRVILEGIDASIPTRSHPYDGAKYDARVKHFDFVNSPESIRQVLEDFKPWEKYEAIEYFYQLLEWVNGPESIFESSDCRLEVPKKNPHANIPCKLVLHGRVMVFFRDLKFNLAEIVSDTNYLVGPRIAELATGSHEFLKKIYPDVWWTCIQIYFFPTKYRQMEDKFGNQVTFQYNCFGDKEEDLFDGFKLGNLALLEALKQANNEWKLVNKAP